MTINPIKSSAPVSASSKDNQEPSLRDRITEEIAYKNFQAILALSPSQWPTTNRSIFIEADNRFWFRYAALDTDVVALTVEKVLALRNAIPSTERAEAIRSQFALFRKRMNSITDLFKKYPEEHAALVKINEKLKGVNLEALQLAKNSLKKAEPKKEPVKSNKKSLGVECLSNADAFLLKAKLESRRRGITGHQQLGAAQRISKLSVSQSGE